MVFKKNKLFDKNLKNLDSKKGLNLYQPKPQIYKNQIIKKNDLKQHNNVISIEELNLMISKKN